MSKLHHAHVPTVGTCDPIRGEPGSVLANAREAEQAAIAAKEQAAATLEEARQTLAGLERQQQDQEVRRDPARFADVTAKIGAARVMVREVEKDHAEAVKQWRIALEIVGIYQHGANALAYERDQIQNAEQPQAGLVDLAYHKNEQLRKLIEKQPAEPEGK
ncbi:MAG: hypothetical protein JW850_20280 [Thermoflexales bacterium]|nr:hypothetical protein [Thermoflexales bacterium]